jgi:hypothetical protein
MASNQLSRRAVLLIVDHLVDVAPLGHTPPAAAVDDTVAALADLAKLYAIPIVFSGIGTSHNQLRLCKKRSVTMSRSMFVKRPILLTTMLFALPESLVNLQLTSRIHAGEGLRSPRAIDSRLILGA